MKWEETDSTDPDIRGSMAAMRRAAKAALKLGLETGTPVWVVKRGKIVDLAKEYTLCNGKPVRRKAGRKGRAGQ